LQSSSVEFDACDPLSQVAVRVDEHHAPAVRDILQGERLKQRRAAGVSLQAKIGCHTFRATGIITYLEAGGTLKNAQAMAAHESLRTTKLYDRTADVITLDEVERIVI
jgi:integrase